MAADTIHVKHAAELWAVDGPTGEMVEVLAGEVCAAGCGAGRGVLFRGTADECDAEAKTYRIPVTLNPTEWKRHPEEISGCDRLWQAAIDTTT
jgi:hypothetical protein